MRLVIFFLLLLPSLLWAETFNLPKDGSNMIGEVKVIAAQPDDTFAKIAKRYDISIVKLMAANPKLQGKKLTVHDTVVVPNRFILPPVRQGIVINLAELRLYYFPEHKHIVYTFPVALGRSGWHTPLGQTTVYKKKKGPDWHVPKSIWNYTYKKYGRKLPKVMPAGPDNPLGPYALYLRLPGILIHGNNAPSSIGRYVSSGCIRMYNDDVEKMFNMVDVGTTVDIMNEPIKIGWMNHHIFLETHRNIKGREDDQLKTSEVYDLLKGYEQTGVKIHWPLVKATIKKDDGIPIAIGYRRSPTHHANQ